LFFHFFSKHSVNYRRRNRQRKYETVTIIIPLIRKELRQHCYRECPLVCSFGGELLTAAERNALKMHCFIHQCRSI